MVKGSEFVSVVVHSLDHIMVFSTRNVEIKRDEGIKEDFDGTLALAKLLAAPPLPKKKTISPKPKTARRKKRAAKTLDPVRPEA